MPDKYVLDDDGRPLLCEDLIVWATWLETANLQVANDVFHFTGQEHPIRVSTVFLGTDYNHLRRVNGGEPILWETRIFGGPYDGHMNRYTSRGDALIGHRIWCDTVKAAFAPKEQS